MSDNYDDDDDNDLFPLEEEDDPEFTLVELFSHRISVQVEILDEETREEDGTIDDAGKRERRGAELAQMDAMRCLALIARRQPGMTMREVIDLFAEAFAAAVSPNVVSHDDEQCILEYTDECFKAGTRIIHAVIAQVEAERRPARE